MVLFPRLLTLFSPYRPLAHPAHLQYSSFTKGGTGRSSSSMYGGICPMTWLQRSRRHGVEADGVGAGVTKMSSSSSSSDRKGSASDWPTWRASSLRRLFTMNAVQWWNEPRFSTTCQRVCKGSWCASRGTCGVRLRCYLTWSNSCGGASKIERCAKPWSGEEDAKIQKHKGVIRATKQDSVTKQGCIW